MANTNTSDAGQDSIGPIARAIADAAERIEARLALDPHAYDHPPRAIEIDRAGAVKLYADLLALRAAAQLALKHLDYAIHSGAKVAAGATEASNALWAALHPDIEDSERQAAIYDCLLPIDRIR